MAVTGSRGRRLRRRSGRDPGVAVPQRGLPGGESSLIANGLGGDGQDRLLRILLHCLLRQRRHRDHGRLEPGRLPARRGRRRPLPHRPSRRTPRLLLRRGGPTDPDRGHGRGRRGGPALAGVLEGRTLRAQGPNGADEIDVDRLGRPLAHRRDGRTVSTWAWSAGASCLGRTGPGAERMSVARDEDAGMVQPGRHGFRPGDADPRSRRPPGPTIRTRRPS